MASTEEDRETQYLCPYGHGLTMRRYGRISLGYIVCTVKGCDELHVEGTVGFRLQKKGM
ncbi:MAG: hypothetical protein AMQ22_00013 [Candidatus Methanofastidiosum methylothiophilum]|uniref:Uncharacterized protein n=1 Tax=Candidatus Methanofastidiosum methylothiophilum TaxID=1705564 RepID=A0A150JA47_9EURY|nr:MAG: hypothetical protein AMQ22_00013 [Candidatus Methanofastidiosum methylthiophilus]